MLIRSPESLPSWERGLKFCESILMEVCYGRSPRGSVDWNTKSLISIAYLSGRSPRGSVDWNYGTQKLQKHITIAPLVGAWIEICAMNKIFCPVVRRSPRGSVDWNYRGSVNGVQANCRSPRGSVDWNMSIQRVLRRAFRRSPRGSVDWNDAITEEVSGAGGRSPRGSVDWNQ